MKPSPELLAEHIEETYGADKGSVRVAVAGRGCHGAGYLVEYTVHGVARSLVIKRLEAGPGLGHDHPPDRAAVLLAALHAYGRLPRHVGAREVLALGRDGGLSTLADAKEYYLVMERADGSDYFSDLDGMADRGALDVRDMDRIDALAKYLARMHRRGKTAPNLYLRRLRDTIGHGECLMGVFDTYGVPPPPFTSLDEMADIEARCVRLRAGLKKHTGRLCVVHGDFHPGNILFTGPKSFVLLDRSRGEYGEPADDVTALTINYVFYSLLRHGEMRGAYEEALVGFYDRYLEYTGDGRLADIVAIFYAFRGAVVANPLFYPDVTDTARKDVMAFIHGVLSEGRFDPSRVNGYIEDGRVYRKRFGIG